MFYFYRLSYYVYKNYGDSSQEIFGIELRMWFATQYVVRHTETGPKILISGIVVASKLVILHTLLFIFHSKCDQYEYLLHSKNDSSSCLFVSVSLVFRFIRSDVEMAVGWQTLNNYLFAPTVYQKLSEIVAYLAENYFMVKTIGNILNSYLEQTLKIAILISYCFKGHL